MSAAMQAIINGVRAAALGALPMPAGPWSSTGWGRFPQLVIRPRGRRPALAIRQDA
ncbi:hypothetical protein G4Z16_22525 [Streptomyces bathyalis]|uniref:Uncharacterized protein n=1 Tax=Streptomyces bathyalis TaxID=2710756 RepID=A0A7T1T987_9ACTN|nr:hypothetical protein [Streptomyces bathyalis]QPP08717.1 hypothetical protein G4Z16_22525 [Streptomyces bathyalis]